MTNVDRFLELHKQYQWFLDGRIPEDGSPDDDEFRNVRLSYYDLASTLADREWYQAREALGWGEEWWI